MADEMEYLQPSFDPGSVNMPKLRNILMTHDIKYPPSAKKPDLVEIFNQQLKPKARRLLAARDQVRRTSEGITHVPSSQESSADGDDDDRASMPPPPVPNTSNHGRQRRGMRARSEDKSYETSSRRSTTVGRRVSSKHGRQSDTEPDVELPRPSARKARKSEGAPRVKVEETNQSPRRPQMPESAFSDENPFQSGSSPLVMEGHRRRTVCSSSSQTKGSSDRRRTDGSRPSGANKEQKDGAKVPSSKTFEVPFSRLKETQIKSEPHGELEPGEDFTPEEQVELAEEREKTGVQPPRKLKRSQRSSNVPRSLPWMILTTLLGGYATWYRQEKLAVGYCGVGRPSETISNIHIPEWADAMRPVCETCPQHATCYENLETGCDNGFILQPHPLSLNGLVPLPPSCEPDGEKARKIKAVADRAVKMLRERNAQAECGTLKNANGKAEPADMAEQRLKTEVEKRRRPGMTEAEFEDLWKGAFDEIIGREEVVQSGQSPEGVRLASTSLARLPFGCAIRRSIRLTLARYRVLISFVTALCLLIIYVRHRILQSRADAARVPSLVATTLDRLATQAALYSRGDALESWISVGQLRDDVLRDEFSNQRREKMWRKVRNVVEKNANVRASSRELRGGDVSRVWEWIGSIGLLGDPGFSGRKSGGKRVSWGGVTEEGQEESRGSSPLNDEGHMNGEMEHRKWDEGRPIY